MTLVRWKVALMVVGATASGVAHSDDRVEALRSATLAASCAACHGTDGHAMPGAPLPPLAGSEAGRIREAMQAFRRGTRDGTVMPQIAKGYSDEQIDRIATWFALQPAGPRP